MRETLQQDEILGRVLIKGVWATCLINCPASLGAKNAQHLIADLTRKLVLKYVIVIVVARRGKT